MTQTGKESFRTRICLYHPGEYGSERPVEGVKRIRFGRMRNSYHAEGNNLRSRHNQGKGLIKALVPGDA